MKWLITHFVLYFSCFSFSQTLIKGKILGDDLLPYPQVLIITDNNFNTLSDANGNFKIVIDNETKSLEFSFLGLEKTKIYLEKGCENFDIIIPQSPTYCFDSEKKAKRLSAKRFKKLRKKYDEAYCANLIRNKRPCGIVEFVNWKINL
jgi:hypothetical protein